MSNDEAERLRFAANEEQLLLDLERAFVEPTASVPLRGLAFSGGGIRSAAFAMGVTQALVAAGDLGTFHYLSTVSGGGYFGSALTWWLSQDLPMESNPVPAGTSEANFPFGSRKREGEVAIAQNRLLGFIRQHASYLRPTSQLGLLSALAVILRASFLSLLVHFTLLLGFMGHLLCFHLFEPVPLPEPYAWVSNYLSNPFLLISVAILGMLSSLAVGYALLTRVLPSTRGYAFRTVVQTHIGRLLGASLTCGALGVLPFIYMLLETRLEQQLGTSSGWSTVVLGGLSTLIGTLLGAREGQERAIGSIASKLAAARPVAGLLLVLYGLFLGALALADHLRSAGLGLPSFLAILGLGLGLGLASNVNYLGLHRMYRDRLMELFTPSPGAVRSGEWRLADLADGRGIHQMCGAPYGVCKHPYHLINTNVVLVDSTKSEHRGRGGGAFVLSPLFCGSKATGWVRSDRYMNAQGGRGMSLPSAMAISGAAVNPNAGVAGQGLTRSRIGSLLLGLLNLRLGYFAPNPRHHRSRVPNFIVPALGSIILGRGLSEDARIVELTDGGHFENLGIYELIRRRCQFILVTDAGQDGKFQFGDLANAVERVRVDFGVKVTFEKGYPLDELVPPEADAGRLPLAKRAFAVGTISYPERAGKGQLGTLIYIKSTLFPGLPVDVLGYKLENSSFPHQSTSDQFFDERQFEAYRELGYHAGWNYLESELGARQRKTQDPIPF